MKNCKFCKKPLDKSTDTPTHHKYCITFIKKKIEYFKEYANSHSIDLDFQIKHWSQFLKYIKH